MTNYSSVESRIAVECDIEADCRGGSACSRSPRPGNIVCDQTYDYDGEDTSKDIGCEEERLRL